MNSNLQSQLSYKLIKIGFALFLLGLLTGFVIPAMRNPRLGLSSHLEGVMNGMFLILLGIVWSRLSLTLALQKWGFWLALIGTYTNWVTTLLAGFWGAGAELMPIAGGGLQGLFWQEILIKIGLGSLSVAMLAVCLLVIWSLKPPALEE